MAKVIKLTHHRLLQVLEYDRDTGFFRWLVRSSNRIQVGNRAGVVGSNGHRFITIDREKLQASRLAWFFVHRVWPSGDIRVLNGNLDDCSLDNLRDVSRIDSARERGLVANNTTGFKGVSAAPYGKFQAKIMWNYRQLSLGGNFETAALASAAYVEAEKNLIAARGDDAATERVIAQITLEKRQRAAWSNLVAQNIPLGWASFAEFVADIPEVSARGYAIAPLDAGKPIGPGNFRWANDGSINTSTPEGKRAYSRANRANNKDQLRDRDFRKKYGIDFAEYQRMLLAQNGVCAICNKLETKLQDGAIRMLSVDHNHATSAVRGLLCGNCNLAIGYACDDVTTLQKAIDYLERHDGVEPSQMDRDFADAMKRSPHRDWLPVATLGFGA